MAATRLEAVVVVGKFFSVTHRRAPAKTSVQTEQTDPEHLRVRNGRHDRCPHPMLAGTAIMLS